MISKLRKELKSIKNPQKAEILQGFFKTGKGEYGEGDIFLGITVPEQRKIAKKHAALGLADVQVLLNSKIHEERLVGLLILIDKFKEASDRKQIFDFYLGNTKNINNWDLVDLTADKIVGEYLLDKDRSSLLRLAKSSLLWDRRISIIATFAFIKKGESKTTFEIAELLIKDRHDLIHKAAGWMLREIGKRISEEEEEKFLRKHYKTMPRAMLRYAIERFGTRKKSHYMKKLNNQSIMINRNGKDIRISKAL